MTWNVVHTNIDSDQEQELWISIQLFRIKNLEIEWRTPDFRQGQSRDL